MAFEDALIFCRKLLHNCNIQTHRFPLNNIQEIDLGLRRLLGYTPHLSSQLHRLRENRIYVGKDSFACCYCVLILPHSGELFCIGPYLAQEISDETAMALLEQHHLSTSLLPTIRRYYRTLPVLDGNDQLLVFLNTLGETIWGDIHAFEMETFEEDYTREALVQDYALPSSKVLHAADLRILENRYEAEKHLMYAVSHGMTHQARMLVSNIHTSMLETRSVDPLRDLKNYAIVLNTLLRKAAEEGEVHPLHIDQLSSSLARKIEAVHTMEEGLRLFHSIVHKYCLLVKNHSMKNYSLLVQHTILRIESDLTADLSLKAHAAFLNVNPSYLSTLFKKETGMTLTEYVNRKRVDQAIFLLNATDMQVQTIAQYCGIPDVNYFTKTFKRLVGKTPKEYRQSTRAPKSE